MHSAAASVGGGEYGWNNWRSSVYERRIGRGEGPAFRGGTERRGTEFREERRGTTTGRGEIRSGGEVRPGGEARPWRRGPSWRNQSQRNQHAPRRPRTRGARRQRPKTLSARVAVAAAPVIETADPHADP